MTPVEGNGGQPIRALATEHLYDAVFDLLRDVGEDGAPRGPVLDFPAGHGAFAQRLLENGYPDVHCLDINEQAFVLSDGRVTFRGHDAAHQLPYPDGFFERVFSIEGLEHFENPWTVVRELCRVLRPGGEILISTPNTFSVDARLKFLLSGYFPRFRPLMQTPDKVMGQDVDDAHISPIYFWQLNYFLHVGGVAIERLGADARLYKPQLTKRLVERLVACMIQNNIKKRRFPDPGVTSEEVLFGDCLIVFGRKAT